MTKVKRGVARSINGVHVGATTQSCLEYALVPVLASNDENCISMSISYIRGNASEHGGRYCVRTVSSHELGTTQRQLLVWNRFRRYPA